MKKNIHPVYHPLKIKLGNEEFNTYSAYPGKDFLVEVDFRKHPAWMGGKHSVNESNKDINKFKEKFAGLSFGMKS